MASPVIPSVTRAVVNTAKRARIAVAPVFHGVARSGTWVARRARATLDFLRPLAVAIWGRVRPILGVVSGAGWAAAAVSVVVLVSGVALGWTELTYLGAAVAGIELAAGGFLVGRSTFDVDVDLTPNRVVVGDRAAGQLLVTNVGERSALPSRMELPVGESMAEFAIRGLKPGAQHEELFRVPTHHRAVIVAGPAVSVRGDPLGLLRRTVRWTEPVDLFVRPRTATLTPSAAGLVRDLEGQVTKRITANDLSFHALRDYVPGDDRRNVHWRSSARTGDLMVRQYEETRRSQMIVLHSEYEGDYASDDEFELAVSVTASIAAQVIRDGTRVVVASDTRRLRTHSPGVLLDDSCRLLMGPRKFRDARTFARTVTARMPAPSVVVVVAGSRMTLGDYRGIEALFPADTTVICVRAEIDAMPSLRPISRMQVAVVGRLDDLPAIIRKAGS